MADYALVCRKFPWIDIVLTMHRVAIDRGARHNPPDMIKC